NLLAFGTESSGSFIAGYSARSPCGLSRYSCRDSQHARQNRHGNSPSSAYRNPRSRRIFQRKTERLVGDAAQEESSYLRADKWTCPRGALERASRIRERCALARARYFAFIRR